MEYGPFGTLFDLIASRGAKKKKLHELEIIKIISSVNWSLVYLNSKGYNHFDIKIENLLFYDLNKIKLCDFGSINKHHIDFKCIDKSKYDEYMEEFDK